MDSDTIKKVALGAAGLLLAGGVLFYLSKDEFAIDMKVHTKERMLPLLDELRLEYTCIYVRNHNKLI